MLDRCADVGCLEWWLIGVARELIRQLAIVDDRILFKCRLKLIQIRRRVCSLRHTVQGRKALGCGVRRAGELGLHAVHGLASTIGVGLGLLYRVLRAAWVVYRQIVGLRICVVHCQSTNFDRTYLY